MPVWRMTQDPDQIYQEIVSWAETDAKVLAFILGGSRGKGFATECSDFDCVVIVEDEAREAYRARMDELPPSFAVGVYTLQQFAEHAAWGGAASWDRYNWAHLCAQVDKTGGKIQALIDEKSTVPIADERTDYPCPWETDSIQIDRMPSHCYFTLRRPAVGD